MQDTSRKSNVIILLAEDDDGHAELIKINFKLAGIGNKMIRFKDGLELWEFLSFTGGGHHREHGRQYLLLLDIRMPRMDGVEVLEKIKSDPELKKLPIIMLTTTDDPKEIEKCYALGCNSYITKPLEFAAFSETLRKLGEFILMIQVAGLDGD